MRQGGHVLDGRNFHAGALSGGDGRFSAGAGACYTDFELNDPEFFGGVGTFFRGPLSGERGAFSGALKTQGARRIPTQGFAESQHKVSPLTSVMVIKVLLNEAFI